MDAMDADELLKRYAKGERQFKEARLSGIDLKGANLEGINLESADLTGANLSEANLTKAYLKKQISVEHL